jgi:hypothetical protein
MMSQLPRLTPMSEKQLLFVEITGVHYAVNSKGKPTFINFDKPYPNQDFTVMIWNDERAAFGSLERYTGRQACAHGVITEYRASRR